ncbi:hypothetical protein [Lagierella sp.]|uniref:hypothetical protein n=1 Tax=Lagierella sp. TaxID=2849657 RepID=UPI0026201381|nr:hypothetical protein [Lagierella sp.]
MKKWMKHVNRIYLLVGVIIAGRILYLMGKSPIAIGPVDGYKGGVVYYNFRYLSVYLFKFLVVFGIINLIFYFMKKKSDRRSS